MSTPCLLANPVLVPKKTGGLRMCIDYTDLNIHCPKDPFPLPRIDQVVDSTTGSVLLSFLDCNSGYHQIALHPNDEDKTMFITPHGIYCYKVMTFGLKTPEQPTRRQSKSASFWSTDQKLYFLLMSLSELHRFSSTRKERPS
jgi:hypothetical protein